MYNSIVTYVSYLIPGFGQFCGIHDPGPVNFPGFLPVANLLIRTGFIQIPGNQSLAVFIPGPWSMIRTTTRIYNSLEANALGHGVALFCRQKSGFGGAAPSQNTTIFETDFSVLVPPENFGQSFFEC